MTTQYAQKASRTPDAQFCDKHVRRAGTVVKTTLPASPLSGIFPVAVELNVRRPQGSNFACILSIRAATTSNRSLCSETQCPTKFRLSSIHSHTLFLLMETQYSVGLNPRSSWLQGSMYAQASFEIYDGRGHTRATRSKRSRSTLSQKPLLSVLPTCRWTWTGPSCASAF